MAIAKSKSWEKIFIDTGAINHNFSKGSFELTASDIKKATQKHKIKEPRILCTQTTREMRPEIFQSLGLFLLPVKNGIYRIFKGEGYVDIPEIEGYPEIHKPETNFKLESSSVGNSEMQHVDYAFAQGLINKFTGEKKLHLTIRGRKYTPGFNFKINNEKVSSKSVQTEVDAGYESEKKIILLEAKNSKTTNTIIRQLFYPYKLWASTTSKSVVNIFFEKRGDIYNFWEYQFNDNHDYNSIELVRSKKYKIQKNKS